MGNGSSLDPGIEEFINSEFEKLLDGKDRDYLTLSEILKIEPPEEYPFNFYHIGNLYVLDNNQDGRIQKEEMIQFGLFCSKELKNC